ncbi:hypothetical protein Barb4_03923 [Bacteroidales bacterium Barb4]|nr:hypothetical protein Barb4_03923 [Bacteroidales bacterium Barb4]
MLYFQKLCAVCFRVFDVLFHSVILQIADRTSVMRLAQIGQCPIHPDIGILIYKLFVSLPLGKNRPRMVFSRTFFFLAILVVYGKHVRARLFGFFQLNSALLFKQGNDEV